MRIPVNCERFLHALILLACTAGAAQAEAPKVTTHRTPGGVEFAVLGDRPAKPAATLFVFAIDREKTLTDPNFNSVGNALAKQGFVCVSLDAPAHGNDNKENEPRQLLTWRKRLERGEDLVAGFTAHCSAVLDHLIKQGYTDPSRVAVAGTSRGGFLALHFAAAEPRVLCVAAFAPVTDLLALSEFDGMKDESPAKALAVSTLVGKLAGRPIWIWIGNDDDRVGTDHAIDFSRKLTAAAKREAKPAPVELHVMATQGHSVGPVAHAPAAAWIAAQITASHPEPRR